MISDSFTKTECQEADVLTFPLTDAHAHIGSEAEVRERLGRRILSMVSAGNPKEAERLEAVCGRRENDGILIPTYGLHPWHANLADLEKMKPFLERSAVIGEIGMDSVWCDVPLGLQREVFEFQLAYACDSGKPAVLHTKGQEQEIADIIRRYPNRYLVHWYSSEFWQEDYLKMDCYFSIGPDVWWNPAVRKLAKRVPADRILIETDGLSAVRWAYEEADRLGAVRWAYEEADRLGAVRWAYEEADRLGAVRWGHEDTRDTQKRPGEIPQTIGSSLPLETSLKNTMATVSMIRRTGCPDLANQIKENFIRFYR